MQISNFFPLPQIKINRFEQNKQLSFKGNDTFEKTTKNNIGSINHQTAFFREPKTDEFVQNYIKENFKHKSEINIVSGACSSGEEAYSYACMLDDFPGKVHIIGFDIDKNILKSAVQGKFNIKNHCNDNYFEFFKRLQSENFLLDDNVKITDYQQLCKEKFFKFFYPLTKKITVNNISTLQLLLGEFTKEKIEKTINLIMQEYQKLNLPCNENDIRTELYEMKQNFETNSNQSFEIQTFQFNHSLVSACDLEFKHGDIMKLNELFNKKEKVDVFLYRNALYHNLCHGDMLYRTMSDDAKEKMTSIAQQINNVLSEGGLLVFGEEEYLQGIDKKLIFDVMSNNGFEPITLKKSKQPAWHNTHIWRKI